MKSIASRERPYQGVEAHRGIALADLVQMRGCAALPLARLSNANMEVPKNFKEEGYSQTNALIPEIIAKFQNIVQCANYIFLPR